jgi:hypothetical protein
VLKEKTVTCILYRVHQSEIKVKVVKYVRIKQPLLPSPFNKFDLGLLDTNKNNNVKSTKEEQKYTFVFTPECRSKSKDGWHWATMPCSTIQI